MFIPRTHDRNSLIERDEFHTMHSRQMEQRGVGHLPVASNVWNQLVEWGCCQRWRCFHILMVRVRDETLQQLESRLTINRYANHLRI